MGLLRFGLLTFKNNTKQFLFYLASIVCSVTFILINFNLLFNESIYDNSTNTAIMGLMVAIGAIIFVSFANSYFLKLRSKEMAILMVSGKSEYEVCTVIFYENFFIFLLGSILGVIVSALISPLIMPSLFEYMGLADASYFSLNSIGYSTLVLVMVFVQLLLINLGYFIRKEPREIILNEKNQTRILHNKFKPINLIFLILTSTPFIVVVSDISIRDKGLLLTVASIFYAIGSFGLMKYILPYFLNKIKKVFFMGKKTIFMAVSNVEAMQSTMVTLVVSLISTSAMTLYVYTFDSTNLVFELCTIIAYFIILLAVNFSIMFKLIGDAFSKIKSYKQLLLVGFTKTEVKKIIKLEVILNYFLITLITGTPVFLTCYFNIVSKNFSNLLGYSILISTFSIPLILMIVTYLSYRKVIFKNL